MPIITVQFIKDVVATPEQKRELVVRLTDTFVDILGEVVRPFVYCLIEETAQQEWGIAGVPMPDLAYLTGEKHAGVIDRSNDLMRQAIASMAGGEQAAAASAQPRAANERADKIWRGEIEYSASAQPKAANERADKIWRGEIAYVGAATKSAADHAAEHRALFERWFEELWNKKNYAITQELVDPEFVAHGAGGQDIKQGPDGVAGMVKAWHEAMPDGRMTLDDIVTEGDLSTIRMTWRGTHTGKFGDIPASGNEIEVTSIGIDRVIDGKITEGWGELNMLGMLQQMGAIPTPDASEASPTESTAPTAGVQSGHGGNGARTSGDEADRIWRGEVVASNGFHTRDDEADRTWRAGSHNEAHDHAAEHRALFERWFEELWNKKNYAITQELVDPEFVAHGAGGQDIKQGPDGVAGMVKAWHEAMPDGRMTLDDIVTEGDLSTIRMTWRGTHTGKFGDIPASGNEIEVTSIGIDRVIDGKITEGWGELNMLGMLQQMGAIPTPESQNGDAAAGGDDDPAVRRRNRRTVQRYFDIVSSPSLDGLHEIVAESFTYHGRKKNGLTSLVEFLTSLRKALPDLVVSPQFVVSEGDRVSVRSTFTGTHRRSYAGEEPSGRRLSWTELAIFRLDDEGGIAELWQDLDAVGMLMQMGVIPVPTSAASA